MYKLAILVVLLGTVVPSLCQTRLPTGEIDTGSLSCASDAMEQAVTDTFRDGIQMEVTRSIVPNLQCRVGQCESNPATSCQDVQDQGSGPVSYTHLTLPTIYSV